jgi:DNA uptake protein ComE-like DNA-binding protein
MSNPKILYSNLGSQIRCEVPSVSVKLEAFGEAAPLSFDLNTVEEGVLRMIPGVTDLQVTILLNQRRERSFSDVNDFKKRSGLSEKTLAVLSF